MNGLGFDAPLAVERVVAYDRRSVERFFVAACERRAWLLKEIATARRRIADAEAAISAGHDVDARLTHMVLDAQRQVYEEIRENKGRIAAVLTGAASEAERIAGASTAQVRRLARRRVEDEDAAPFDSQEVPREPPGDPLASSWSAAPRPHERRHHPDGASERARAHSNAPRPLSAARAIRF